MRILLAEDDQQLGDSLNAALALDGYAVDWLSHGDEVLSALELSPYDALILDIGLPGQSGLQILQTMRQRAMSVPVILLTARDRVEDRVNGLDLGADDYLSKPFDMDELFARLRSLIRRSAGIANPALVAGELELFPHSHEVKFRGEMLNLPSKEVAVLEILVRNRGRFVSKTRLEEGLYSWGDEIGSNTVEVYISHLRKQLGGDSIETLRGIGYRLTLGSAV
jgi:DNA-binding response OmpR family regulator